MSYTMLLADDSSTTHRVMELTFAGQDIRVESVADGEQAVEWMRTSRPDIVVAEVALPRLDGYSLTEQVRRHPELSDVPVLLLTGAFDVVDEARVRASGAAGIIVKPFEPETVIKRVKDLLGMSSKDADVASTRLVTSAEPPAANPPAAPAAPAPASTHDEGDSAKTVAEDANRPGEDARAATDAGSAWGELRQRFVAGSDKPDEAPASGAGTDVLEQLGTAFDNLDQQLSGSSTGPRTTTPHGPGGVSATTAAAPAMGNTSSPAGAGSEPPVFEIDEEWFGGNLARAVSARPAPAPAPDVADSFHALLDAEQGPAAAPVPATSASERATLSEDAIERIARRVAERLSEGVFVDTVRKVAEDVAERLVREEIARIRARVEEQRRSTD